jgi:HSP20 family protein
MAASDKLKEMVEELRHDLSQVKEQVKELLPLKKNEEVLPVRRQPSEHPISALQRETNRLFEDFLRGSWSPFSSDLAPTGEVGGFGWPRIDIDESDRDFHITADLAGLDREDIDLSVGDGVLTIRGEKKHDNEDAGRHHYRRECFYGAFSRSVPIPADVDPAGISAKMKSGVLRVIMPKLEERASRDRKIPIG